MFKIPLDRKKFAKRYANIANARCISDYSVTHHRDVFNDRRSARHLNKAYINDSMDFDLKKGIDTFINKGKMDYDWDYSLHPLCKWACAQEGDNLKEVFSGAKFAGRRETIRLLATAIMHTPKTPMNAWTVIAVKTGGVILLCEKDKEHGGMLSNAEALDKYSGFKFEQCMTTDIPYGPADTDSPVDIRPSFMKMVRSDIVEADGSKIEICCASEINALDEDAPVELQVCELSHGFHFPENLKNVLHTGLADVKSIVIGWKTEGHEIKRVTKMASTAFKRFLKRADEESLAFLSSVLHNIKRLLLAKDACEIIYVPQDGSLKFVDLCKEEVLNLLTPEFKEKFHIGQ